MKVGQTNEALPVDRIGQTGARPAGGSGTTPPAASVQTTDTVELSQTSRQLANSGDVIDASKVERIKAAIAEGKFPVNAQKVADSMIHEAASLLESIVLGKAKS